MKVDWKSSYLPCFNNEGIKNRRSIWPSLYHVLQVTAPATICLTLWPRQSPMTTLTPSNRMNRTGWSWSPPCRRVHWGWTAGWSAKNRMRCWILLSRLAPSCSQLSHCHWGSSWINMDLGNFDCWAGEQIDIGSKKKSRNGILIIAFPKGNQPQRVKWDCITLLSKNKIIII